MSSCIKKTKMRGQGSKPRISKKLNLDDVCGVQNDSFKNKRGFQNHYRTIGMESPSYWRRVVGTESEGEGLFRAVVHTNAYNI